MKFNSRFSSLAANCFTAACLLAFLSACNIFDPIDSPSGDRQLLSAARACFDKGDFSCAREYYGKLSGDENAIAELAFLTLDEEGMDIGAIIRALSISDGESIGSILTELAVALSRKTTPGEAKRQRLVQSYKTVANITDKNLRGFVRFTTAIAIAAEVLAEEAGIKNDNVFSKTDLVLSVAACSEPLACGGGGDADCIAAGATIAAGGSTSQLSDAATADMPGAPAWGMFVSAINAVNVALGSTELDVDGGDSLGLVTAIITQPLVASNSQCARALLVKQLGAGR